jgi:hypothetical protein
MPERVDVNLASERKLATELVSQTLDETGRKAETVGRKERANNSPALPDLPSIVPGVVMPVVVAVLVFVYLIAFLMLTSTLPNRSNQRLPVRS